MVHKNLGVALQMKGRPSEAEAAYRRALDLRPDYVSVHYNHAQVHRFSPGDPEIEILEELLKREDTSEEDRSYLLFALGKAHDDIGLYARAFSCYRQGNEQMRADVDASRQRRRISKIKEVFRDRNAPGAEDPGREGHLPIFVVGMSRSGKTLVESLLSQHEDVYGAGETPEWADAIKRVLSEHSISEPFPDCMGFLADDQIREIGERYVEAISTRSPGSRYSVNTLPGNYAYIGLILQAIPLARVIYCQRNPLDNCLIIYFQRYDTGNEYSYDLRNVASYYALYRDMMAHWQRLYGERILDVRYEEMVQAPQEMGARIYGYCGLEYDPAAIQTAFTTEEMGRWRHYEPYLGTLREALGVSPGAQPSSTFGNTSSPGD
jgi:tetratricopeptide (TPR) repeat protein